MSRKHIKYILITVIIIVTLIWSAGTAFLLTHGKLKDEYECRVPYVTFAFTWPLWKVLPDSILLYELRWSTSLCPKEEQPNDNLIEQPKTDDTP